MGMFPYTCYTCGGAYKRCAYRGHLPEDDEGSETDDEGAETDDEGAETDDEGAETDYKGILNPCKDGQFCWEDNCIILSNKILHVPKGMTAPNLKSIPRMRAIYDGYGCFDIDEIKYPACKDYKFVSIDFHELNVGNHLDQVIVRVIAVCSSCYGDFELESPTIHEKVVVAKTYPTIQEEKDPLDQIKQILSSSRSSEEMISEIKKILNLPT